MGVQIAQKIHRNLHRMRRCCRNATTYARANRPIVNIPRGSQIYAFGTPSQTKSPLISNLEWTVNSGEAWAIISGSGGGGKGVIFKASFKQIPSIQHLISSYLHTGVIAQTLLGHTRLSPPSLEAQGSWAEAGGLYPFLASVPGGPYSRISHVSFRQRTGGESGAFFDYTARYGAMREEEDKVTLRETLKGGEQNDLFHALTEKIGLSPLLDLPLITLSNGQARRARIVKAILDRPEILLLDEPLGRYIMTTSAPFFSEEEYSWSGPFFSKYPRINTATTTSRRFSSHHHWTEERRRCPSVDYSRYGN